MEIFIFHLLYHLPLNCCTLRSWPLVPFWVSEIGIAFEIYASYNLISILYFMLVRGLRWDFRYFHLHPTASD